MDAGFGPSHLFDTAANTLEWIEQVEQEAAFAFGLTFDIGFGLVAALRLWLHLRRRPGLVLHDDVARRGEDQSPGR